MEYRIVDDDKISGTTLKQLALNVNDIEIVGECSFAMEAYNL